MIAPEPTIEGQESVWSYPRPPVAEPCHRRLCIRHCGVTIADSRRIVRTLETSHPPSYYFPISDVAAGVLRPASQGSFCEWKGEAAYFDVVVGGATLGEAAWTYPDPGRDFESLRGHVAFYAGLFDDCFVDGERVTPQPGGFYGGWITSHVAGPFKGVPGSRFW